MITKTAIGWVIAALLSASLACSFGQGDNSVAGEPTATAIISGIGGSSCDNPLLPIRPGALWLYNVSGGAKGPYSYSTSIGSISTAGFTEDAVLPGIDKSISWECTSDGLGVLTPVGGAAASLAGDDTFADFETVAHSGVTLPPLVSDGQQWSQVMQIKGTQTLPDGSQATSTGAYTISFTAGDSHQNVTVPAGTFSAQRIEWVIDLNVTATVSGVSAPLHVGLSGVDWYAPGVGLVKEMVEGEGGYTVVLASFAAP